MLCNLTLTAVLLFAPVSSEYASAHSVESNDMKGFETSLYQGKWFKPSLRDVRKCIMHRESRFKYAAKNNRSSARGAYQFLDSKWRDSLVWMMLEESKETKDGLASDIRDLRDQPIHKWSRYFQDRAFYTVWRFGEGSNHWYYHGSKCP